MIPQHTTNRSQTSLTFEISRDRVLYGWYERAMEVGCPPSADICIPTHSDPAPFGHPQNKLCLVCANQDSPLEVLWLQHCADARECANGVEQKQLSQMQNGTSESWDSHVIPQHTTNRSQTQLGLSRSRRASSAVCVGMNVP